jgi:MFS transporter, DHA1 family, tetracycline resistance protein
VCSLISTPVIGNLSDRYGRRPLLLISQAGTCAGFIILGISNALWMVFLGRILDGITAGNLSTAQAYISDHTKPEDRAKSFGIIGIAFGIGFMFGPGMGGWLSSHYGMHMPFIVSACLSFISIVCTWTLLPRELPPQARPDIGEIKRADAGPSGPAGRRPGAFDMSTYVEFFNRPGLGSVYTQYFLFTFAFSCFTSGFALFAEARYGWGARQTGYLFTYAGLLGIFLQGGLIGRLVKRFGEVKLSIAGFAAALAGYIMLGFAQSLAFLLVTATVNGFGSGVLRPVLSSRISQMVGRHEQGVALGIAGSLSSLAMTLGPPSGGAMLNQGWLQGWTTVAATVSLIGFIAAVATRSSTRAASAAIAAKLPKAPPDIVAD